MLLQWHIAISSHVDGAVQLHLVVYGTRKGTRIDFSQESGSYSIREGEMRMSTRFTQLRLGGLSVKEELIQKINERFPIILTDESC